MHACDQIVVVPLRAGRLKTGHCCLRLFYLPTAAAMFPEMLRGAVDAAPERRRLCTRQQQQLRRVRRAPARACLRTCAARLRHLLYIASIANAGPGACLV